MATIRVTNQTQLDVAIKAAKSGDTVVLAAGNYKQLWVDNKVSASAITFKSESATNPAVIGYARAVGSDGVVFQDLKLYHLGPQGDASWADFAVAIMDASGKAGGPSAAIRRITTTDYPTPAKRPANSVLDCTRIAQDWDIALPHWEESCQRVVTEIVAG